MRTKGRPSKIKWSTVDWTLGNTALSLQTGYSQQHIGYMRRRVAPETGRRLIEWPRVKDWSQGNHEIAAMLGCSAYNVATHRSIHNHGPGKRKPGSGWHKKRKLPTV